MWGQGAAMVGGDIFDHNSAGGGQTNADKDICTTERSATIAIAEKKGRQMLDGDICTAKEKDCATASGDLCTALGGRVGGG